MIGIPVPSDNMFSSVTSELYVDVVTVMTIEVVSLLYSVVNTSVLVVLYGSLYPLVVFSAQVVFFPASVVLRLWVISTDAASVIVDGISGVVVSTYSIRMH